MTEYHYHKADHPVLEVKYFSRDEIIQEFTELLASYRSYDTTKPKSSKDTVKTPELKDLEDRAKVARDTFHAAFRGMAAPTEQYLLSASEDQARKALQKAIEGLYSTITNVNGPSIEQFASNDQCSARLMELTSDTDVPNTITHWPVIQKIR